METHEAREFRKNYETLMGAGRTYVGLVPILEDTELSANAKILFHIISSLSFVEGYCYATNRQLSGRLGLELTSVKKYIAELQDKGLINSKKVVVGYGIRRRIFIDFLHIRKRYLKVEKVKKGKVFQGYSKENLREMYYYKDDE